MKEPKKHIVTSALPYANGPLHIGHIAGAYLPADIYVRFLRAQHKDVVFICGSDEHGAAITIRAKKEGITPKEIVDKYHEINKKAFADFGISFDMYHRTSSELHHQTASDFFLKLHEKGAFDVQESEQYFDEENAQFLADRYITGTCPKCSNENAYGDQCEKCGSTLSPTELINPKSTLSGNTPVLKKTKHWYLPMQNHEEWLTKWIKEGELDGVQQHDSTKWRKQVLGQCMSWIDGGLAPRAMTRDLDWGVKVPLEEAEGKVLYVWLDAPIGYISATKEWAAENGKDWKEYWCNDESELTHFIAKDNIVFHCIIFPILLKTHGGYNLPVNVPSNEFLNLEGDKISTSREWAVWLHEYLEEFPDKQDELRYTLTSIAPENKDSEFTWKEYQARVNNELAAILGNFVNRVSVLTSKYYNGELPTPGNLEEIDNEVIEKIKATPAIVAEKVLAHKYRDGLTEAMNLARVGNKYLADTEPWKLVKENPERVQTIMFVANQILANLSIVMDAFIPNTCKKIRSGLGLQLNDWSIAGDFVLNAGDKVEKLPILFSKIEDEVVGKQVALLEAKKAAKEKENVQHQSLKENISFDDFMKMDIRSCKIIEAEKVKKADKLLKLTVDTGLDTRTIVSGIAEHYKPEDIVGEKVVALLNLEPRKIRGIVSQGMILMAEDEDSKLAFVQPDKEINTGSIVR